MKPIKLLVIFLGVLLLLTAVPVYMYLSHDVSQLQDHYPHLILKGEEADYAIQKSRPAYWVSLSDISPAARWAIVLSEDWAFYQHGGVDLEQMKVALNEMLEGERFRGASTITQQTVKNIFLSNERSLWRKVHEIVLAYKLERSVGKARILEIYLNSIEYGPGLYGIRQASKHYFQKDPRDLTPREGAFLALMLPSPVKYYTSFRKKVLSPFVRERLTAILQKMRLAKIISPEELESQMQASFHWEYILPSEE
jgi:monofunctional glycosyltransferase